MKISQEGIDLIKKFEGCRLDAYKCPAGVWTIGYGHTAGVKQGQKISAAQAEAYLKADLEKYEKKVKKYSKYKWTQNEFDSMVSFAYNCGSIDGLTKSGTRSKGEIAEKIVLYNKDINGRYLSGLARRRKAEQDLFLKNATATSNIQSVKYIYKGMDYSLVFEPAYYSDKYTDLKMAFGSNATALFNHFCTYGMKEGRQASAAFNVQAYRERYADLQKAFGDRLPEYYKHYIQFGHHEKRNAV